MFICKSSFIFVGRSVDTQSALLTSLRPSAFPFEGSYQVPRGLLHTFCALHTPFAVEGDAADGACQTFLQRLTASSRPEPTAAICELACAPWCDPCCDHRVPPGQPNPGYSGDQPPMKCS